jgi:uncharacterized membrane protein YesL
MGRFFNLDSPVMVFLSKMADLMILNLVMLVICIPIITIGPALTGMHYVLLKMVRKEEGYLLKPFFKSFKDNFKVATLSWLIMLVVIIIFFINARIIMYSGLDFPSWLPIALVVAGIFAVMAGIYVFPLIARFENNIRNTFKNALFISILNLPKTVLMIIVYALPVIIAYFNLNTIIFLFLFGITAPSYVCAMLYSKTFKRFEPEEEEIDADSWTLSMEDDTEEEVGVNN